MARSIERIVLRWLRAAAPPDWTDSVVGDLREELAPATPTRARLATSLQLARIAARFTHDRIVHAWRHRPRGGRMSGLLDDCRHAMRSLAQSPAFTSLSVLTLAVAIGANTAIYSALSALVLHPLPFPDGTRYVYIWHKNPEMGGIMLTPPPAAIEKWRAARHIFDAVESYASRTVVVTEGGEPEEMPLTRLQPGTLQTIGVAPIMGRAIDASDAAPDAPPVVLISHAFWTNRFGRDPGIVGRPLRLGDTAYTIVGVLPRRFELPHGADTLWTAAKPDARSASENQNTLARLAPGVTAEQAQAALDAIGDSGGEHKGWTGQIIAPGDSNGTQIKTALYVLMGAVGLLLLIACVNVANLVLSRQSGRTRELAMRHALGASRWRLMRLLFVESAGVAAMGGLAGLAIAHLGLEAMATLRPRNLDVLERIALDGRALWFAAGVSALTALLCGAAPAFTASRAWLHAALSRGGRSATAGGQRVRRLLTATQVALALVLLVGAALLLRSYSRLTEVDPGYDPTNVLSVAISLPSDRYPSARRQAFFDQVLTAVRAIPGVTAAAVGNGVPPESGVTFGRLEIERRASADARSGVFSGGYVTPEYFTTLRIPVLDGRVFTGDDLAGRDRVVVLGAAFARQYFPNESPIGRRLRLQSEGPWSTVIGVVGDVRALSLAADSGRLQLYHARAQMRPGFGAVVVRTAGDPQAFVPAIKAAIWAQDPALPLRDIATAGQLLARSISQSRFNMALLAAFAACGLLLAVVGVYGVTALYVGQRHREVGIRMALGATRTSVAGLIARQTALVLAAGVLCGLIGAAWLSRFMRELVFQIATTDAASYAVPALAVVVAALAATLVPLRRATRIDPAVVLRTE
jgi:predicted permease